MDSHPLFKPLSCNTRAPLLRKPGEYLLSRESLAAGSASYAAAILYLNPVALHEHVKCPRCQVALGRFDSVCWACRHVIKAPVGTYIKYVWIWTTLQVAAALVAVVVLIKYRTQVEAIVQAAIRSILKAH